MARARSRARRSRRWSPTLPGTGDMILPCSSGPPPQPGRNAPPPSPACPDTPCFLQTERGRVWDRSQSRLWRESHATTVEPHFPNFPAIATVDSGTSSASPRPPGLEPRAPLAAELEALARGWLLCQKDECPRSPPGRETCDALHFSRRVSFNVAKFGFHIPLSATADRLHGPVRRSSPEVPMFERLPSESH